VQPSGDDGPRDAFSSKNAGIRLYHPEEDAAWAFGANGHLGYGDGEKVVSRACCLIRCCYRAIIVACGCGGETCGAVGDAPASSIRSIG
jgi:hypothetical protein